MGRIEDVKFFNVKFGEIVSGSYGTYEGLMSRSDTKKWGTELRVVIHCFHANGKTFVIWTGGAVEDMQKNLAGFQLIESSFLVR